ncbi:MAG: inositol oxygenase, partial [Planctomycetes bacterium]|nr:inositol oxygenase [Planctomycetota bacterium]
MTEISRGNGLDSTGGLCQNKSSLDRLVSWRKFMPEIEGQGPDGEPLERLDDWEDFVANRYPEGDSTASDRCKRSGEAFRDYRAEARTGVKEFYKLNHTHQTLEFVEAKKEQYLKLDHKSMGVWEAIELLDTLVDDS